MMKKWITFDLDGTLMQNPFVGWVFPEIETAIVSQLPSGNNDFNVKESLVREHERRLFKNDLVSAYDWDDIVQQLLHSLGLLLFIDVETIVKRHSIIPKVHLLEDGTLEVLDRLKDLGYSLAAVTNGFYKYQYPVMEVLGLVPLFDAIVTPDLVGCGKPDTGIFKLLEKEGKIVAHVGDRLDHDVQLANLYGTLSMFIYGKLPAELKGLSSSERINDPAFRKICQDKWRAENKTTDSVHLSPTMIPKGVIHSIGELLEIL